MPSNDKIVRFSLAPLLLLVLSILVSNSFYYHANNSGIVLAFKPHSPSTPKSSSQGNNPSSSNALNHFLNSTVSNNNDLNSQLNTKPSGTEGSASTDTTSFLPYKNSHYSFSMQYPSNWKVVEGRHIPGSNFKGMDAAVAFVPPGELATSKGYTAFVGVYVDHAAKNLDMQQYLQQNVRDVMRDRILTNLTLDKANTNGLLSGQPAYVMSYSTDKDVVEGNAKVITKEIGTKIGNDYYFIDYIAYKDRSNKYLKDAQKMVD